MQPGRRRQLHQCNQVAGDSSISATRAQATAPSVQPGLRRQLHQCNQVAGDSSICATRAQATAPSVQPGRRRQLHQCNQVAGDSSINGYTVCLWPLKSEPIADSGVVDSDLDTDPIFKRKPDPAVKKPGPDPTFKKNRILPSRKKRIRIRPSDNTQSQPDPDLQPWFKD